MNQKQLTAFRRFSFMQICAWLRVLLNLLPVAGLRRHVRRVVPCARHRWKDLSSSPATGPRATVRMLGSGPGALPHSSRESGGTALLGVGRHGAPTARILLPWCCRHASIWIAASFSGEERETHAAQPAVTTHPASAPCGSAVGRRWRALPPCRAAVTTN
jgi:hypothetical protein